jgi:hypothetical protein
MVEIKKRLKGGSLSATSLIIDGKNQFVRKEVSISENREYGFQRWYSQLKKMQRYEVQFPGIFPKILKFGQSKDMAYFDMEYFENFSTAQEFLILTKDKKQITKFTNLLIKTMQKMHKINLVSNPEAIDLYLHEEVNKRLSDCYSNESFTDFIKYETLYFNGELIPSFSSQIDKFYKLFDNYINPSETFTHGNLTLENILYSPEQNKIVFIDPYEENIIDSKLAEYSQIYQSCNSKYEIYNSYDPKVINNSVDINIPEYDSLNYFNEIFTNYVKKECDDKQFLIIKLLEISQFIRMLPFKMAVDENKMILFYSLASKLFNDLQTNGCK